jgi:hypothetical protein
VLPASDASPAAPRLTATLTAFYLFDVADAIGLDELPGLLGQPGTRAHLTPKSAAPPHFQYQQPPLTFDRGVAVPARVGDLDVRVRMYDYGVVSLALTRPFTGSWAALFEAGERLVENPALDEQTEACCREVVARIASALTDPRTPFLEEDYVVFAVTALEPHLTSEALLDQYGTEIARLLRAEPQTLSRQERDEVLKNRLSYLADDLVVPTWNTAFVYDTEAGASAALEILEFANSQLLQFRYYDELLDSRLARLYAELQRHRHHYLFGARRYTRSARQVQALAIDVRELLDRTENALKFVGDIYSARLFALAAARLGLERWKGDVRDKLQTLDGIYHFAVEQTNIARGEFLESTIVAILVLELVLFFLGIMK